MNCDIYKMDGFKVDIGNGCNEIVLIRGKIEKKQGSLN